MSAASAAALAWRLALQTPSQQRLSAPGPPSQKTQASRLERVGLPIAVVLLAAWLRLTELGLTRFTADQANLLGTLRRFVRFGEWPTLGPDIGPGLYGWGRLGPIHFYLSAPAFALSGGSPRAVIGCLAALHVVAVALTIRAGARFLGPRVGWLAGLLLAVAPYPVFISRELVNFAFLPPIAALLLLALLEVGSAGRRWWIAVALPCAAAAVQLHATAWAYVPLVGLALFADRRHLRRYLRPLALGALLSALVLAPYVYGLAAQGFTDLSRFLEAASSRGAEASAGAGHAGLNPEAIRLAFGLVDMMPHPPEIPGVLAGPTRTATPLAIALGFALLVAPVVRSCVTRGTVATRPGPEGAPAWHTPLLISAWFAIPPLMLTAFRDEIYLRHLVVLYPVPALLAALPFATASTALTRRRAPRAAAGIMAVGVVLAALLALHTLRYRSAVRDGHWIAAGMPLVDQEIFADFLVDEEGFSWESYRTLHLPGLGDSRYGLRYLIEERTDPTAPRRDAVDPPQFVLSHAAQQPRCEPLSTLTALLSVGPLQLTSHATAVVTGSLVYELPDGRRFPEIPFDTESEPGTARFEASLDPRGGETGTWVVVTNGCIDEVRFAGQELYRGDCAWHPVGEPWPVSHGFALPPGAGSLEIAVLVPAGRVHLDGYELPYRVRPDPRAPGAPFPWGTITLHPLVSESATTRPDDGSRYLE